MALMARHELVGYCLCFLGEAIPIRCRAAFEIPIADGTQELCAQYRSSKRAMIDGADAPDRSPFDGSCGRSMRLLMYDIVPFHRG
jgi:hypothetical protein